MTKPMLLATTAYAAASAGAKALGAFAAHSVDVSATAADAEPKTHVQLLPMGVITGRDGRGPYRLDDLAHAQAVVEASLATAGATQIPIDYDHQIVFAAREGVGGQAPASGWVTKLTAQADGIWADVEWTAAAAAKLQAKEYRYISPYFGFDKATGRVTRILNAGLTILPNFTELAAVALADPTAEGNPMSKINTALGLAADATEALALEAINALKAKVETTAAAAAGAVDPTRYVPIEAFIELRDRAAALTASSQEDKATAAVDAAVKAGKITPAGRAHALELFKASPEQFEKFVGASPVILRGEALDTSGARPEASALTAEEKKVARMLAIPEDKFLASKKQVQGA